MKSESQEESLSQQQHDVTGAQSLFSAQDVHGAQRTGNETRNMGGNNCQSHAPTQQDRHAPTRLTTPSVDFTGQNVSQPNYPSQSVHLPQMNLPGMPYSQWVLPNGIVNV